MSLIIKDIDESDAGKYTVIAENELGTDTVEMNLTVQGMYCISVQIIVHFSIRINRQLEKNTKIVSLLDTLSSIRIVTARIHNFFNLIFRHYNICKKSYECNPKIKKCNESHRTLLHTGSIDKQIDLRLLIVAECVEDAARWTVCFSFSEQVEHCKTVTPAWRRP